MTILDFILVAIIAGMVAIVGAFMWLTRPDRIKAVEKKRRVWMPKDYNWKQYWDFMEARR